MESSRSDEGRLIISFLSCCLMGLVPHRSPVATAQSRCFTMILKWDRHEDCASPGRPSAATSAFARQIAQDCPNVGRCQDPTKAPNLSIRSGASDERFNGRLGSAMFADLPWKLRSGSLRDTHMLPTSKPLESDKDSREKRVPRCV